MNFFKLMKNFLMFSFLLWANILSSQQIKPFKNVSKYVILKEVESPNNDFLTSRLMDSANVYNINTRFNIFNLENIDFYYFIDYSMLDDKDTVSICVNNNCFQFDKKRQKYRVNDSFSYSGDSLSLDVVKSSFIQLFPEKNILKIDTLSYKSYGNGMLLNDYFEKDSFFNKIELVFSENKSSTSKVRFLLYGSNKFFFQEFIVKPHSEGANYNFCFNNFSNITKDSLYKSLYLTDLGFYITRHEYDFYKSLKKRLKNTNVFWHGY